MKKSTVSRYIASDGSVRVFFIDSTEIVKKAQEIHKTLPTATAALGRCLTAASLMGSLMKDKSDALTLQIKCEGIAGGITCVSDYQGNVRGYIQNPLADKERKPNGKLDVGGIIGEGTLYVIRDFSGAEPYIGMCELVSGEIAEDITTYYAQSEQTPSVCALGVLVNKDETVRVAGGFLLQLMPGAEEETIAKLEKNISTLNSLTSMMDSGRSADDIASFVFDGIEFEKFDDFDCEFLCNCSKEKYAKGLVGLGKKELDEMMEEGKPVETKCRFCNSTYVFEKEELEKLRNKAL